MPSSYVPLRFDTVTDAQRYVRRQLERGLPDGWAAQWQEGDRSADPFAGRWHIAHADAVHDGKLDASAEGYDLLLTNDLGLFLITYAHAAPGPWHWSYGVQSTLMVGVPLLAADALPTREGNFRRLNLTQANLGDIVANVIARFRPNVYDLT